MTVATDAPSWQPVFEQAFGASWRRGPIPTALDVLESDLRRVGGWQSPRLPEPALEGGTETPLLWTRRLSADELARGWVVSIDKHAAYLGVLGGLELGIGNPVLTEWWRVPGLQNVELAQPGYWRVKCIYPPPVPSWPDPLGRDRSKRRRAGEAFWITTPTLELAIEAGLEVDVRESWTWPVHRRLLRPFGQRCTNARNALKTAAETFFESEDPETALDRRNAALEAQRQLKHVYAAALGGFLARLADRKRDPRPPWYRPDWRHHIIAKARANLWRNLTTWRTRGLEPIGIYNDAFYIATNDSSPDAVEAFGVRLDDSLGGYTIGSARRLREVVADGRLSFPLMFGRV